MPHGRSPRHHRTSKRRRRPAPAAKAGAPTQTQDATPNRGPVRLQKLLASAGLGSRRACEEYLRAGRVTVNGEVAKLGDTAKPGRDLVAVDGERLVRERLAYWVVHKPAGVVTTVNDPQGRRTVMELLPGSTPRLYPVGRLDYDSTGLVLLTNDGDLTQALLHPSLGSEREYRVTIRGELDSRVRKALEHGVMLDEGRTAPAKIARVVFDADANTTKFSFTLAEGRNRQIRRSLLTLGRPVKKLVRLRMGPLRLGTLARGKARALRHEEVSELQAHAHALSARRRKTRRLQR